MRVPFMTRVTPLAALACALPAACGGSGPPPGVTEEQVRALGVFTSPNMSPHLVSIGSEVFERAILLDGADPRDSEQVSGGRVVDGHWQPARTCNEPEAFVEEWRRTRCTLIGVDLSRTDSSCGPAADPVCVRLAVQAPARLTPAMVAALGRAHDAPCRFTPREDPGANTQWQHNRVHYGRVLGCGRAVPDAPLWEGSFPFDMLLREEATGRVLRFPAGKGTKRG